MEIKAPETKTKRKYTHSAETLKVLDFKRGVKALTKMMRTRARALRTVEVLDRRIKAAKRNLIAQA